VRSSARHILLLAAALAMRLFVPAGYMIDAAGTDAVRLVICDGTVQATAAGMAHHHTSHPGKDGQGHCPFAVAMAPLTGADPPHMEFAPRQPASSPAAKPERAAYRPAASAPPPPSTGPPALV
jgi:hypothetical protein